MKICEQYYDSLYEYCKQVDVSYYNWIASQKDVQKFGMFVVCEIDPISDPVFEVQLRQRHRAENGKLYVPVRWGDRYPLACVEVLSLDEKLYTLYQLRKEPPNYLVYWSTSKVFKTFGEAVSYAHNNFQAQHVGFVQ
jgi:hypothetical protein